MTDQPIQPPPKHLKLATLKDSESRSATDLPLPAFLRSTTRSATSEVDPLLAGIKVEQVYRLAAPNRDVADKAQTLLEGEERKVLVLETEDGTTLFIHPHSLSAAVERLCPEAIVDGFVDLERFRDPNATARGVGEVLWKVATVLGLPDDLLDEAKQKAIEWAKDKLGEVTADKAVGVGSFLGTKALIWIIESRLAGRPGLYHWYDKMLDAADCCPAGDPRLHAMAEGKPALVLIHGTGSYTLASFGDLREDKDTWDALTQRFPGGIFGFEHRSFSESPIENALALLEALPAGARVSFLTHSRGGLVGDLLCLGQVADAAINAYQLDGKDLDDDAGLARESQEERTRLSTIRKKLPAITVERYVRVACPARGTRLLSANLDAALSDFLNLLQWGGGAAVGAVASALGGPVAGQSFGKGASSCLGVLKRLVLEIAGRRIDARLVPGIAAMRTDSPLAAFLANPETRRRDGIQMAVIAGDTEFDGLGLSNLGRRVANLFCDWRLFDRADNDLVVDTDSMYAGLGFRAGAKYLYDQDASVTHFRYFRNPPTRDALRGWLTSDAPDTLDQFQPLTSGAKLPWQDRRPAAKRGAPSGPQPVAIIIPGIMGTHIEINRQRPAEPGSGNRIWFDPISLGAGGLARIAATDAANVQAEDIFEMFYGDLVDFISESHAVLRCPYDWRQPLDVCADALKAKIDQAAVDQPGQPIRLLAHSMGGLVTRRMIAKYPETWQAVLESGGRLVMLGTPNNGAHLMVHTLLGKSSSMRMLEKLDLTHGLNDVLDIVAGFPGALALLPRPGFVDSNADPADVATTDYYRLTTWGDLANKNTDFWYGPRICGKLDQARLDDASKAWQGLPARIPAPPDRVAYVFGQSDKTPCGVRITDRGLDLLFTPDGDGSVTWESGKLDGIDLDTRCWYMPVEHADLTGEPAYFPAVFELLKDGVTDRLTRLPRRRGVAAPNFTLEAGPPVMPNDEELARAFMGSGPRRPRPSRGRQVLRVSVRAGDISFMDQPVLCGHYIGDPISGAEAALDRKLGGALSERERMGVYAGDIGTSAIVLRPPSREEAARKSRSGAVIVGLGKFTGRLSAREVSETVRAAVLRFLLQLRDAVGVAPDSEVHLCSVLVGWGTSGIGLKDSVAAVTIGVLEANHEFRDATGKRSVVTVTDLCFIELYRDAAISAAQTVCELPDALQGELNRLRARVEPAPSLDEGEGVKDRLGVISESDYWSRLIVTDADAPDSECPPECYEVKLRSPIPPEVLRRLREQVAPAAPAVPAPATTDVATPAAADKPAPADDAPSKSSYYPERLKYVFLSPRARAETIWQRRQPRLIETIIRDQRHTSAYDAKLAHTLFQLMVPLDYKAAARDQARLLLVLDGYTANLPWELLRADEQPLAVSVRMIRQLATARFRPTVRTANSDAACIIVNPSTAGFDMRFPGKATKLDPLPGAVREGEAVAASLRAAGWNDIVMTPEDRAAVDIFNVLYDRPYRVLMIGAHGIVEAEGKDGRCYTGVVLSDGLLITAVEIGQMEVVPEVVVLSCCHLGTINPFSQPNRLAYSVARELIDMGVRCVVAAGWAVDDDAACTFSSTLFERLTNGYAFGEAVFDARRTTYLRHQATNTWGAYQAYGDPSYRLHADRKDDGGGTSRSYVAVEQLLSAIGAHQLNTKKTAAGKKLSFAAQRQWIDRQLARCPADWAQRPDVLQAIGAFYGDLGTEGFEEARRAYERAIQLHDKDGRVAIRSIEQLANIEARVGEGLANDGKFEQAEQLIEAAIGRLNALEDSVKGQGTAEKNAERAALLGSALKRMAAALVAQVGQWKETRSIGSTTTSVPELLAQAAAAYRSILGGDPAKDPYNALNWLPLAWLAGSLDRSDQEAAEVALACGAEARKRFATSKDFWDAVMSADAEMTAWLIGGHVDDPGVALRQSYADARDKLPISARELDSTVKQWRLLALFLIRRNRGDDTARAAVLTALADEYRPMAAGPAAAESAKPVAAPKATAKRRPGKAKKPK